MGPSMRRFSMKSSSRRRTARVAGLLLLSLLVIALGAQAVAAASDNTSGSASATPTAGTEGRGGAGAVIVATPSPGTAGKRRHRRHNVLVAGGRDRRSRRNSGAFRDVAVRGRRGQRRRSYHPGAHRRHRGRGAARILRLVGHVDVDLGRRSPGRPCRKHRRVGGLPSPPLPGGAVGGVLLAASRRRALQGAGLTDPARTRRGWPSRRPRRVLPRSSRRRLGVGDRWAGLFDPWFTRSG